MLEKSAFAFTVLLDRVVVGCSFTGFAVDGNQCVLFMILRLLLADDMLIFYSLDREQFLYLKCATSLL